MSRAFYHEHPEALVVETEVSEARPGRVLAVYIRNVSRDPKRIQEIEDLARVVAGAGSSLVLAADSQAMAVHAVKHGLVAPTTLAEVRDEKVASADTAQPPATYSIQRATPAETADAVSRGGLQHVVETGSEAVPPSVIVEPKTPSARP